jgi:hypothetical protein
MSPVRPGEEDDACDASPASTTRVVGGGSSASRPARSTGRRGVAQPRRQRRQLVGRDRPAVEGGQDDRPHRDGFDITSHEFPVSRAAGTPFLVNRSVLFG